METKIINGHPQPSPTFGNRMITYDGLIDFLEMLKREIPKMGLNNHINIQNANNYLFGSENQSHGSIQFAVGKNNYLGQNTGAFALGADNYLDGGKYCFALGKDNTITDGQYCLVLGEGHNCSNFKNSLILGSAHSLTTNATPIPDGDQGLQATILGEGLQIYQFDLSEVIDYSALPPTYLVGMYNKPYIVNVSALQGEKHSDEGFRLFEIGNGSSDQDRSTCFYVEQSGKTVISQLAIASPQQSITLKHQTGAGFSEPEAELTPGLYIATMSSQYTLLCLQAIENRTITIETSLKNQENQNRNIQVQIEPIDQSNQIKITVKNMQLEAGAAFLHLAPVVLFV